MRLVSLVIVDESPQLFHLLHSLHYLTHTQTHTNSNMWWDFRLVRDFPFHETTNTTGMQHIFGERSKRFDFSRVSRVFRTWQFQYIYINGTIMH